MVNFLLLLILHILGDFYFQTTKIAWCKNAKLGSDCGECKKCGNKSWINYKYLFIHLLLYVFPFLILCYLVGWGKTIIIISVLFVSHGIVDAGACFFNKKTKQTIVFLVDQMIHVGILWLLFYYLKLDYNLEEYNIIVKIIFIGLVLVMPCSIIINKLLEDIYPETVNRGMFDIGSMIGVMERILTIIFAYYENFAAIAIIITVKTWARTNDLKEPEFRNKYLLGTLTSLVLALLLFLTFISI